MADADQVPGPLALAAFAAVVLALSALVLVHQERSYEHDPQLRARAGLVNADSDISLMRSDNFAGAPARILSDARARFGLLASEFERLELDIPSGTSPGGWSATWSQPTDDDG